jgi:translation initiation factor 1
MDFKDQLKNLFPDHQVQEEPVKDKSSTIWLQDDPLLCKYEKRKGKPITIIDGYNGASKEPSLFKVIIEIKLWKCYKKRALQ